MPGSLIMAVLFVGSAGGWIRVVLGDELLLFIAGSAAATFLALLPPFFFTLVAGMELFHVKSG